jgi:dUTP pyrophosphatase
MRGFKLLNETAIMPTRGTKLSSGYDFYLSEEITLQPNEMKLVFSNVAAYMEDNEVLKMYIRSSLALKGITFANSVGIIDADYFGNPSNGGNIGLTLVNNNDYPVAFQKGERVAQGIFQKYLVADEDIVVNGKRTSGFGSTGV